MASRTLFALRNSVPQEGVGVSDVLKYLERIALMRDSEDNPVPSWLLTHAPRAFFYGKQFPCTRVPRCEDEFAWKVPFERLSKPDRAMWVEIRDVHGDLRAVGVERVIYDTVWLDEDDVEALPVMLRVNNRSLGKERMIMLYAQDYERELYAKVPVFEVAPVTPPKSVCWGFYTKDPLCI